MVVSDRVVEMDGAKKMAEVERARSWEPVVDPSRRSRAMW
jgi:hypothetical protein